MIWFSTKCLLGQGSPPCPHQCMPNCSIIIDEKAVFIQVIFAPLSKISWAYFYGSPSRLVIPSDPSICLSLYQQNLVFVTLATVLKLGGLVPPTLSFLFFSELFCFLLFHRNFRIILPLCTKNCAGVLIRISVNLYINLGKINIFMMLNLSIHEHKCFSTYLDIFRYLCQHSVVLSMQVLYLIGQIDI